MWRDKIIGQDVVLQQLSHAIETDSLSHAIIFSGRSGYGGLPIALWLSQSLLCQSPVNGDACGTCKSCLHIDKLIHPDLHMAYPVVGKEGKVRKNITSKDYIEAWRKAVTQNPYLSVAEWVQQMSSKKANVDINVAECGAIAQSLAMKSFVGDRRVQIIWMSQYLGHNANKLLKLIEEPPPGTYILLLCDHTDQLLKTVVSRCRVIDIHRVDDDVVAGALRQNFDIEGNRARHISFLSEGDYGRALGMIVTDDTDLMDITLNWFKACQEHDYRAMRIWSEQFAKYNIEEQKTIANFLLGLLREVLHLNVLGEAHCRLGAEDIRTIQNIPLLMRLKSTQIEKIHASISELINGLERNILARMLMFQTCLQIDTILRRIKIVDRVA